MSTNVHVLARAEDTNPASRCPASDQRTFRDPAPHRLRIDLLDFGKLLHGPLYTPSALRPDDHKRMLRNTHAALRFFVAHFGHISGCFPIFQPRIGAVFVASQGGPAHP
jgi:hypothetical protein